MHRLDTHQSKRTAAREQSRSTRATSETQVLLQRSTEPAFLIHFNFFQSNEIFVENVHCFLAENISESACHSRTKIETERTKHENGATSHILAAVLSNAFHHGKRTAIANGKTFSGAPRHKE